MTHLQYSFLLFIPFTESHFNPQRVPGGQSGSVQWFQSWGGRDIPAPGCGRPGTGEPDRGPQETEEGKAVARLTQKKNPPALPASAPHSLNEILQVAYLG